MIALTQYLGLEYEEVTPSGAIAITAIEKIGGAGYCTVSAGYDLYCQIKPHNLTTVWNGTAFATYNVANWILTSESGAVPAMSTCIPRSDADPSVETEINDWNDMMRAHFATPLSGASYGSVAASGWGAASGASRAALFDAAQLQSDGGLGYIDGVCPDAAAASSYAFECGKVLRYV